MPFGLEILAADPIPRNRQRVPVLKSKNLRLLFEDRDQAERALARMKQANHALEIAIVFVEPVSTAL